MKDLYFNTAHNIIPTASQSILSCIDTQTIHHFFYSTSGYLGYFSNTGHYLMRSYLLTPTYTRYI
ncbi:hypothetical protein BDW68DRAFT_172215, partial [Aspergillus falconensis]